MAQNYNNTTPDFLAGLMGKWPDMPVPARKVVPIHQSYPQVPERSSRILDDKPLKNLRKIGVPYIGRDGHIRIPISNYYAPDANINTSNPIISGNSQSWNNGSSCSCGWK